MFETLLKNGKAYEEALENHKKDFETIKDIYKDFICYYSFYKKELPEGVKLIPFDYMDNYYLAKEEGIELYFSIDGFCNTDYFTILVPKEFIDNIESFRKINQFIKK